jgi:uncharacterized protein
MHQRLEPKLHGFGYRIFMFALDLDEIDIVATENLFFSHNAWNLYEFRDRDHLTLPGHESRSVKENVVAYLSQNGIQFPADGRIQFITLPRVFGYVFNPVSFFFCFDAAGAPLCAVVQVGNTFGEQKLYHIPAPDASGVLRLPVFRP